MFDLWQNVTPLIIWYAKNLKRFAYKKKASLISCLLYLFKNS